MTYDVCACGNRKRSKSRNCMACHLAARPESNLRLLPPDAQLKSAATSRDVSWWAEGNPTACRLAGCGATLTAENVRAGAYCSLRCRDNARQHETRAARLAAGLTSHGKPRQRVMRRWTADEDAVLMREFPRRGRAGTAALLPGRSTDSVRWRASYLGLTATRVREAAR